MILKGMMPMDLGQKAANQAQWEAYVEATRQMDAAEASLALLDDELHCLFYDLSKRRKIAHAVKDFVTRFRRRILVAVPAVSAATITLVALLAGSTIPNCVAASASSVTPAPHEPSALPQPSNVVPKTATRRPAVRAPKDPSPATTNHAPVAAIKPTTDRVTTPTTVTSSREPHHKLTPSRTTGHASPVCVVPSVGTPASPAAVAQAPTVSPVKSTDPTTTPASASAVPPASAPAQVLLFQTGTVSTTVSTLGNGAEFQLSMSGGRGLITYTMTSNSGLLPYVQVSPQGLITLPGGNFMGSEVISGTATDAQGDAGMWTYTVTSPGN